MALSDYQTLVENLTRDSAEETSDDDRDQAIQLAVTRYSVDRPITDVEQVVSDDERFLVLPAGWVEGFSRLDKVTLDDWGNEDPVECGLTQMLAGMKIKLGYPINVGNQFYVYFTRAHTLSVIEDTVPAKDQEAVAKWAAALVMDQLSSLYSGDQNSTIEADNQNFVNRGRDYASRAKAFRQFYFDHLGIDHKRTVPAGVVVDLDRNDSRGQDRLHHGRRRR